MVGTPQAMSSGAAIAVPASAGNRPSLPNETAMFSIGTQVVRRIAASTLSCRPE